MSYPHPNAERSQPQNPPPSPGLPNLSDFAALAAKLQETAGALLVFCQSAASPENDSADDGGNENPAPEKPPYQIRSYQLPGYMVKEEQKMLEAYKAGDWKELFNKVYNQLYTTIMLMQRVPAEDEIDGFSVQLIAENLMMPLDMLSKLCSLIADFRLVHEVRTE